MGIGRRTLLHAAHHFYVLFTILEVFPPEDILLQRLESTRKRVSEKGLFVFLQYLKGPQHDYAETHKHQSDAQNGECSAGFWYIAFAIWVLAAQGLNH